MKKLIDSDWLRALRFKGNNSVKSVTPEQKVYHHFQLHIVILDYDWRKDSKKFCRVIFLKTILCNVYLIFHGSIFALLLCLQLAGMLKYFDTEIKLLLLTRSCKAMTNISYGNSEKKFF